MTRLKDNKTESRFEMEMNGAVVFSDYDRHGVTVSLTHVETPVELRGKGAAGALMQEIVDYAKAENLKIRPVCSYAVAWMAKHPEYAGFVVEG